MVGTAIESVWAPVIAALGASVLTTAGLLPRDSWIRGHHRSTERLAAYQRLLAQSMVAGQAAAALRMTIKIRSGLTEGLDIALHHRRPLDPFDLADRFLRDFQPLFEAQTAVWAKGSQEAIPLANELVDRCIDLIGIATEPGQGGNRLSRYLRGEQWTDEQEEAFMKSHRALGESRRRLAELVRREGGVKSVDLIARPPGLTTGLA
jgi:hypothetical protein